MRFGTTFLGVALPVCALATACTLGSPEEVVGSSQPNVTWEEFLASTYQEPWEGGMFIVNGDEPIANEKQLREFYDRLYGGETLIVNRVGSLDDRWNDTQKLNLTYCVSDSFGSHKSQVLDALVAATDNGWETAANVNFIHVAAQDSSCTASNNNVVFDVRPTSGQPYLARAFFPSQSRSSRNVMIDSTAYNSGWPLSGILTHELGHALGFRHEHTRPEAGQCFEDNNWRPLTPYDSSSVMHYPQCGGTGSPLTMSASDRAGAAALYGPPATDPPPTDPPPTDPPPTDPPPTDPPPTGTPHTGSHSATISRGQKVSYQPIAVLEGTRFDVSITGTGDADLYLRFGAAPTFTQYHCRPYLNGSNESCSVDVPAGQTAAYLMVYGYRSASYTLNASWIGP